MDSCVLSDGVTAFERAGDGPVIVFIHGLSTPSFVWDDLLPLIHDEGYSSLRYDLFGRGGSQAGHASYGPELYTRQLLELLDHCGLTDPITICGYSMGGGIAACTAASNPERVKALSLIAPAGLVTVLDGWWRHLNSPIWGRTYGRLFAGRRLRLDSLEQALELDLAPDFSKRQDAATRKPGFMNAVRKSIKDFPMSDLHDVHKDLAKTDLPITAIWGSLDVVIPVVASEELSAINPKIDSHMIEGATHSMPYTHQTEVAEKMLGFLRSL
ncbi:MAG: alpha/beta hydrolase [Pseudomonadota bacterium]